MIKEIMKDQFFLCQKAMPATIDDVQSAMDLVDTLKAHEGDCVGMAANMIGVNKRIIAIRDGANYVVMFNPEIMKTTGKIYETQEGCLCHTGSKDVKRHEGIKVTYYDMNFKIKINSFTGFTAQIIQHEIDHCEGILI